MAGFMKRTMSYLGMSDVVPEDEDDEVIDEEPESSFDTDRSVTPIPAASTQPSTSQRKSVAPFHANINRITTIHPQSYEDAQLVGRARQQGSPGHAPNDRGSPICEAAHGLPPYHAPLSLCAHCLMVGLR